MDYDVFFLVKDPQWVREWGPFVMRMNGNDEQEAGDEVVAQVEDFIKEGLTVVVERVEEIEEE